MRSKQTDYERYDRLIYCDEDYDRYDLRSIADTCEARINTKAYNVMDPISVYNLSRDVYELQYLNKSDEQLKPVFKDFTYNLAELAARTEMAIQPDKFDYLSRASELGKGEILSRNIRHYDEMLNGDYESIEYVSRILSDASQNFAKNLGVSQELNDYISQEEKDFDKRMQDAEREAFEKEWSETNKVDDNDVDDVINSVLENNNESVEYAFHEDKLPYYVTKEMSDRGLTDEQIEQHFQDKRVNTIDKFLRNNFEFDIRSEDPFSTVSEDVKSDIRYRYHLDDSDIKEYISVKTAEMNEKSPLMKSFEAKLNKMQNNAVDRSSEGIDITKK